MKEQTINLNAERLDVASIVKQRNRFRIGPWSLLYNGNKNAAQFAFDEVKPKGLRIKIKGSTGYVRLMRPLAPVDEPGVYSISLTLRSLVSDSKSTFQPYVFSSRSPYLFAKHSKLTPRDGKYVTKLHLSNTGPLSFWIGFETLDKDIELQLAHIELEIIEGAADLVKSLADCKRIDLPLVQAESKSRHYTALGDRNDKYHQRIKKDELAFLIEYANGLRAVEMPETFLRLVRYLVVKYHELTRPQQIAFAGQVRTALQISQDEALVKLLNDNCPELLFGLDVSAPMLSQIAMLDEDSKLATGVLDKHAFYTEQSEPSRLFAMVHRESVRDPNYLRSNPQAYGAIVNAYAARQGHEERYRAFLNRYLEAYQLPELESVCFDRDNALEAMTFAPLKPIEQGPLVSIMMSAFNASGTIGYAIDSLLLQSYRNIEVLVCDDGSEDNTVEIAKERASRDARVRVFRSASNQGTYNIRNDLIRESRGEFLTFHDSDDLALPCRIETQLETLSTERRTVCFSNWARFRPNGSMVYFHDGRVNRFCVVSALAHRSVFERLPPFRSSLVAADTEFYELSKYLFGDGEISIVNNTLIFGLWGDGSLTKRADLKADHSGFVAQRRRSYAEIAARQRTLGDALVDDGQVDDKLRELGLYREHAGVIAA